MTPPNGFSLENRLQDTLLKNTKLLLVLVLGLVIYFACIFPTIFSPGIEKRSALQEVDLILVGDINLGRQLRDQISKDGNFLRPFEPTLQYLNDDEAITFGNLESPLCRKTDGEGKFKEKTAKGKEVNRIYIQGSVGHAESLKQSGFDVVSVSNNHMYDCGYDGIVDTIGDLKRVEMPFSGFSFGENCFKTPHEPVIIQKHGIKVGFLSYCDICNKWIPAALKTYPSNFTETTPCIASWNLEQAQHSIRKLKKSVDFIVVSMHSHKQYEPHPHRKKRGVFNTLLRAGADLIAGGHPHVLQGHAWVHKKLVIYSLGNFVFSNLKHCWGKTTEDCAYKGHAVRETGVFRVQISKTREGTFIRNADYLPCFIRAETVNGTYVLQPVPVRDSFVALGTERKLYPSTWPT